MDTWTLAVTFIQTNSGSLLVFSRTTPWRNLSSKETAEFPQAISPIGGGALLSGKLGA